uniref:Uncharacterized protein n=1 Tax=Strigamia maritima TaxID=126957 RepID=T1JCY7_STRMM
MALKVTIFFGSVREGRLGLRAANYIAQQLKKQEYRVFLLDPEENPFPMLRKPFHHYANPDDAPQYVKDVRKEIISSDAFIVVSAEYNHSMPPALVNVMDHFPPGDFKHKPCGIVTYSVGGFGGIRAGVQLRSFLGELGMITPAFMFPIPKVNEAFSEDGRPQNEHMIKNTEKMINEVVWYANALKNHRACVPPLKKKINNESQFSSQGHSFRLRPCPVVSGGICRLKTETMFVYLSKKIAIPNNTRLYCIGWNKEYGYITCGGEGGLLKILKLESGRKEGNVRGLAAPSNLSMNQTLEGHAVDVQVVTWNEGPQQKLTSSDTSGLIIVWLLHKGTWVEEMINNRNKSVVKGMAWNMDGSKICIVYEDGAVIVGSVDGNRIWGKELKGLQLVSVEWSPDSKLLLFGVGTGDVQVYDSFGNFIANIIISVASIGSLVAVRWYNGRCGFVEPNCVCLVIAYDNGNLQLMRNENDDVPIVLTTNLTVCDVQWNHNGSILALAGCLSNSGGDKEINVVQFYTPYGDHIRTLRVPGRQISACTWEGGGLRIALAVDSYIYFANIRPDYKWCYFANTVVYSLTKPDRFDTTVVFWDTKSGEKNVKFVKHLLSIACNDDNCVLASRVDDGTSQYTVILCNALGTPVDCRYIDIEPLHVTMNRSHVIAASKEAIYFWQYSDCRSRSLMEIGGVIKKDSRERLYHVDDVPSGVGDTVPDIEAMFETTTDPIACVCSSDKFLLIARESGIIQRYNFPSMALTERYTIKSQPLKMSMNCSSSRLAVVDVLGVLTMMNLSSDGDDDDEEVSKFERKDVWDFKWASDNSELLAIMEKTRMYIFRNLDPEEPNLSSGYICRFENLRVRSLMLDELIESPDEPNEEYLVDMDVKSLRDTRELLAKVSLKDATTFIEDNSHPTLWALLAEASLEKLDLKTAENAFVRCKDFPGIDFTQKLANIQNEKLKRAEVATYLQRFDEAEKIYLEMDRKDLAVSLRRKLGDWFRVVQLMKTGNAGDDSRLEEAWNAIGDYYYDRQKWEEASKYYEQGQNHEKLADVYYALEDFQNLESLAKNLADNHSLLPTIAEMFSTVGMCSQSVYAYAKANKVKDAIECCVTLNQWNTAIELARKHHVKEIGSLLAKYAEHLLVKNKIFDAVELYRNANRHLDAAQLMFKVAADEAKKKGNLLRIKKLYVLAALLVEDYHARVRSENRARSSSNKQVVSNVLKGLLQEDAQTSGTQVIDKAWRNAEAYHLFLLAQRQLHNGYIDAAMKTALHLREFDDVLIKEEVYSLLALASCANRAFAVCSKAFIKLESLDSVPKEMQQMYQDLAMDIFTKHSPKDSRNNRSECTHCETMIPDWSFTGRGAWSSASCRRHMATMFPRLDGASSIDASEFVVNEKVPLKRNNIKNGISFRCVVVATIVVTVAITITFIVQVVYYEPKFAGSAIASDNEECTKMGVQVMRDGGSAVDGVVATYLCLSVVHPHVAGLGGGGFMLIRDGDGKISSLDFRETAPLDSRATVDETRPVSTVGVPGLVHGLNTAHKLYGKIPWSQLVSRASRLARDGFIVSPYLTQALQQTAIYLPSVLDVFSNATHADLAGQLVMRKRFANTLDLIAKHGGEVMYTGMLRDMILHQIQGNAGGYLRSADFSNYATLVGEPVQISWKGLRLSASAPPSSGPLLLTALAFFENVTATANNSLSDLVEPILEAWKAASWVMDRIDLSEKNNTNVSFAVQLKTLLEEARTSMDLENVPRESRVSRASSVVAVDETDTFVALTSGLGSWFGSQMVVADGIVLNDALRDIPWTPGARPPTSMSAVGIDVESKPCAARLVTSGASSQLLLQVLLQNLILNKSATDSVRAARFAFSLPNKRAFMETNYHPSLDQNILDHLRNDFLQISEVNPPYISINLLSKIGDDVTEQADTRTSAMVY